MKQSNLVFIKLGGSLITDKTKPLTARIEVIKRLAEEIARAIDASPNLNLLIGHGSGSFGHAIASQYQTQAGGSGQAYWQGFAEVWRAARTLNEIVIQHLADAGLPVIAFPPSAAAHAKNGSIVRWDLAGIKQAITHHLVPVVQGDVVIDAALGGTIVSTEKVFQYLADPLKPAKILLAGLDTGVFSNPDQPDQIIPQITPSSFAAVLPALSGAQALDVTGGMLSKVQLMIALVQADPGLKIMIFSGAQPGNLYRALQGHSHGTLITA
jgi:isopentenyl phosphate kinase